MSLLPFLPKNFLFHPPLVHFPIALWLTSALFDVLYLRRGERFHFRAAQNPIGLGCWARRWRSAWAGWII